MRSILLSAAAALAISSAALAQNANDAKVMAPSASATPEFVQKQETGQLRAPKLVGVSVYDKDNKNVGKIDDLLTDKDGKIQTVVIGIGGFLGIGKKDVALPYNEIHWQTEQRTVATNAAPGPANNNLGGTTTATDNSPAQPHNKTVSPAEQEAYNGYPDRALIDFTQAQLKNAPDFKYASQTMNADGTTNKQ